MRSLLILSVIGTLGALVWTLSADARGSGHGGMHAPPGHGAHAGHMMQGGGHVGNMGILFQIETEQQIMERVAGEPGPAPAYVGVPTSGVVAVPEHTMADHLAGPGVHPLAHPAARGERAEDVIPQPAAPSAAASDQAGAATAQPNPPVASRLAPRPPGAAGPGRPGSGWSGPGRPGPGRPLSPRR